MRCLQHPTSVCQCWRSGVFKLLFKRKYKSLQCFGVEGSLCTLIRNSLILSCVCGQRDVDTRTKILSCFLFIFLHFDWHNNEWKMQYMCLCHSDNISIKLMGKSKGRAIPTIKYGRVPLQIIWNRVWNFLMDKLIINMFLLISTPSP